MTQEINKNDKTQILTNLHRELARTMRVVGIMYSPELARKIAIEFLTEKEADEIDYSVYPDEECGAYEIRHDTDLMLYKCRDKIDEKNTR